MCRAFSFIIRLLIRMIDCIDASGFKTLSAEASVQPISQIIKAIAVIVFSVDLVHSGCGDRSGDRDESSVFRAVQARQRSTTSEADFDGERSRFTSRVAWLTLPEIIFSPRSKR